MSARQHEISQTATLEWYPDEGPPAASPAPTLEITSSDGETLRATSASPAVSRDTTDTTLTTTARAAAAVVGSSTGVTIGRRYWLSTAAGGKGYAERVVDVPSSTAIELGSGARYATTNGKLRGLRLSATYAADANPRQRCRCVWRYTVGGIAYVATELVDFVRCPFDLRLSAQLIEEIAASFGEDLGQSSQWAGLLERAEREAFAWLRGKRLRPELVIDRQGLQAAYALRVLALRWIGAQDDRFARYQEQFSSALQAFSDSDSWYDSSDTLSTSGEGDPPAAPPKRDRIA